MVQHITNEKLKYLVAIAEGAWKKSSSAAAYICYNYRGTASMHHWNNLFYDTFINVSFIAFYIYVIFQIAVGVPFPRFQQTPPTWPRVAGRLSACQPLSMLRLIFHVPFPRYSSGIGCTDNWVWPVTILHHISLVCSWPYTSLLGYPGYLHREGPAGRCDVNVMQIVCVLHECCWLGGEKTHWGEQTEQQTLPQYVHSVQKSP